MNTEATTNDRSYHGLREPNGTCHVTVVSVGAVLGHPLPPRLDLLNKSPTGFDWGYEGSGPAQLALALCADALGDDGAALRSFQQIKAHVINGLPEDEPWTLTMAEVRRYCREISTDMPREAP